jgi:hypothetical protein
MEKELTTKTRPSFVMTEIVAAHKAKALSYAFGKYSMED